MANLAGKLSDAVATLVTEINKLRADVAALKTAFDGHVHGGITAGAANSAAVANSPALTSAALTANPQAGPKS